MKAVIYHCPAKPLWDAPEQSYERLFEGFIRNTQPYVDDVIHITLAGHRGMGTVNVHALDLDPENIMYNRELLFARWLEYDLSDEVYWFTEPDARISKPFPPLDKEIDAALLWRDDDVHITPSFRLCRRSAYPLFQWTLDHYDMTKMDWHGDSEAFNALYIDMGKPKGPGCFTWNGLNIELRPYFDYSRRNSRYVTHHKAGHKMELLARESN